MSKRAAISTVGLVGLSVAVGFALAGWHMAGVAVFIATGLVILVVSIVPSRESSSRMRPARSPESAARYERAAAFDGRLFSIYGQWVMVSTVNSVAVMPILAAGAIYLRLTVVGQIVVLAQLWALWWAILENARLYSGGERDLWHLRGRGRRVFAAILAIYGLLCTAVLVAISLELGVLWQVVGITLLLAADVIATALVFRRPRHVS